MRVCAEGGELAHEWDDLGESRSTVGVGEVTTVSGFDGVATSPEVVPGIINADDPNPVLICELDSAVKGFFRDELAEFFVAVPDFGRGEAVFFLDEFGPRCAVAAGRAEELV